jgi:hypothetical protein
MFKPRTERIAAAIHYYAKPLGWDCTIADLAEATGESWRTIRGVLQHKGWLGRVRMNSKTWERNLDVGSHVGGHYIAGMYLAEAVAAGKVGAE